METKYILRDYQQQAVNSGVKYLTSEKYKYPGIIVIPTGGGKSLVIAGIAMQLDGKVLILQPRKELLEQNYEKYTSYGYRAKIYSASCKSKEVGHVTFATIGSIKTKQELFKDFKYCIIDECHLVKPDDTSMYSQFFEQVKIRMIGLTATPIRLKTYMYPYPHSELRMLDRSRPRTFKQYIHITQISELASRGYFSKVDYHYSKFSRGRLEINSTGADFTEESMLNEMINQDVTSKIINTTKQLIKNGRKHILTFCVSVDEAKHIAENTGGACVSAKTPRKARENILIDFKHGAVKNVVNVGVLTVGFDFPELDTILLGRPTMSLALYYQMIGRGVRPAPGKSECLVYDFVDNYNTFGEVEKLEIKNINGWGIYNGERLLTNSPMEEKIIVTDCGEDYVFNFGKFKDKKVTEVPDWYLKWCYENISRTEYNNDKLFRYIENTFVTV